MTAVAVLGTGHMGAPIARRLLMARHAVTVWNRTLPPRRCTHGSRCPPDQGADIATLIPQEQPCS